MIIMAISKKLFPAALLAGLVLAVVPARAQDRPRKKINWGVTSLSASNWIPWIAKDAKIYEKNGLDVELILVKGSGQTSAALLGGSLFGAPVALPQLMLADLGGADLINIAHTVPGVQSKLLVKPEIKRPEDLKGKKIATSSIGSLGDFLFKYIIRKHGMDPNRDVTWLSIGTPPERLQALSSGVVDAADLSYPADVQGERMGFRILFDARKEVVYPSMSVVTRRKNIQEDRDTVMRMIRSHVEAIAYFKTHKDFSMKVLSKYLRINDRDLLEGSYEIFKQDFIAVPYPITKGLEATYDYVAQTRPEIRNHKADEFVDPSFIAEMDKSGFIKKLYEQR
ncbi:MAG TPA: ABC transporter substrate-binding protein [Candidatus Binatia bacterium]|nr:ABC transporter substrate-binding protein [Candidatus Binatia bacterium]